MDSMKNNKVVTYIKDLNTGHSKSETHMNTRLFCDAYLKSKSHMVRWTTSIAVQFSSHDLNILEVIGVIFSELPLPLDKIAGIVISQILRKSKHCIFLRSMLWFNFLHTSCK